MLSVTSPSSSAVNATSGVPGRPGCDGVGRKVKADRQWQSPLPLTFGCIRIFWCGQAGGSGIALRHIKGNVPRLMWIVKACNPQNPQKKKGERVTTVHKAKNLKMILVFTEAQEEWCALGLEFCSHLSQSLDGLERDIAVAELLLGNIIYNKKEKSKVN